MRAGLYLQAAIAASAMPVVGFITGKVVGEASDKVPFLAWVGVGVYAIALAASYAHLRHYYARFDSPGVKASPFIAFAVEVATFYLSFASVVLGSAWALWGSLVGASVVFWGNFTSMGLGLSQVPEPSRTGLDRELGKAAPTPVQPGVGDPTADRSGWTPVDQEVDHALLEALASPKGPSALARELALPKSTVIRRLKRLVDLGLVETDGGIYRKRERATA
ncbi:helix-turn-helix domain-containing protein [Thermus caldifontis]|uniref:helix-turn-helix domain-containing protein n=1 Tax=Thermus caldifontis TaxID=1930763 RepID=UPI000DF19DC6|nr:winged helix-turn-helix domain-containing protein [Thermus caldifontis]